MVVNVSVNETQAAALRGISADTQRRHRLSGIGPIPFKPEGSKGWRYWLSDIEKEQKNSEAGAAPEVEKPIITSPASSLVATFSEFVESMNSSDSPRGDFVEDTKELIRRGKFKEFQTWSELFAFLLVQNACEEAIAEARKVFTEYQNYARVARRIERLRRKKGD